MMLLRMLPAARAARRTFSTYRPLLEQGKKVPAVGPNPLDAPTLEIVKAQWKKARLAKDSDKATLLGVRSQHTTHARVFSQTCSTRKRPRCSRIRSRRPLSR